jgi:tRNA pseudouridine55 synthase
MNGILNINKGLGLTSFDAVFKIKKLAHTKKVGHTGTLDPEASGVLPICIGGATKFADYIMKDDKVYRATLRLGIVTDTYDKEGVVLRTSEVTSSEEEVISVINGFEGRIKQVPPMYSALKVNGQRLYSLARKGIEIERVARDIEIFSIDIIEMDLPFVVFDVKCSKGTYIRSLCYDIGEKLGCGGAMWALVRTRSGFFDIENSVRLEDMTEGNISDHLIPVEKALWNYPSAAFETKYVKLLLNGVSLMDKNAIGLLTMDVMYKVYDEDSRFIGIGKLSQSGFKMVKQFIEV